MNLDMHFSICLQGRTKVMWQVFEALSGMQLSFLLNLWRFGVTIGTSCGWIGFYCDTLNISIVRLKFLDCCCRDTLMGIAKHYESRETLPEEVYKKILAARTFRAGSMSLHQWAEVLSADAFSAFEDVGLDDDKIKRKEREKKGTNVQFICLMKGAQEERVGIHFNPSFKNYHPCQVPIRNDFEGQ